MGGPGDSGAQPGMGPSGSTLGLKALPSVNSVNSVSSLLSPLVSSGGKARVGRAGLSSCTHPSSGPLPAAALEMSDC